MYQATAVSLQWKPLVRMLSVIRVSFKIDQRFTARETQRRLPEGQGKTGTGGHLPLRVQGPDSGCFKQQGQTNDDLANRNVRVLGSLSLWLFVLARSLGFSG